MLDVALWFVVPGAFLVAYVMDYGQPASAVAAHLLLSGMPLAAICLVRLVLVRSPASNHAYFLVTSTLAATVLALLVVYYAMVLIGLHSWGGVVAWNVLPTFFLQTSMITEVWKIPRLGILVASVLVYWMAIILCRHYLYRIDWVPSLNRHLSTLMFSAILIGGIGFIGLVILQYATQGFVLRSEPFSLTAFPRSAGIDLEGYLVNPVTADLMDVHENAARDAYVGVGPVLAGHPRKNVIFVLVDALRPDHMGLYGYERDTTPNLKRIVRTHPARILQEVHSTCADTACSLFSLFSSQFPGQFAVHPFMLHQVMWRNGYHIHLILSGDKTYFYGRQKNYGDVDTFYDGTQAHGYYVNDDQLVVDKLASMPSFDGSPVLFHFHLMSSHILRKRELGTEPFQPAQRYLFPDNRDSGPGGGELPGPRNFYDNGVYRADAIIGQLLAVLESKGYLQDALVVITADHGESLGEHGLYHHANSVREEVLRIPLVFIAYGGALRLPAKPREFASQVDIAPTILKELGLPRPATWAGRPLQQQDFEDPTFFVEHSFQGLIDRRDPPHVWKYTVDRSTRAERVFDLSADPHEDLDRRDVVSGDLLRDWQNRVDAQFGVAVPVP